ncbi:Alpha/Beta hydrolase protein [Cantharellus anzutake]|uniref:Alpha/Beta hydrolase protein n=1 Tax=Cantharellus anzutake TaxID=1750568 RepID=UPI001904C832|nr:Alpha/Beta hydrolase protein [Cantharellus anzutake]KAF8322358.1 Alpha/Beta hydrolase protein [Cantharellus anzutake]
MRALSSAPLSSFPPVARREFNLDIATLLLQLASVVYEHESQPIHGVLNELSEARPTNEQLPDLGALPPGTLVDSLFGPEQAAPIKAAFEAGRTAGEDAIRRLSDFIGLRYEPVSELNNSEGAYCSFFWKPGGNWVVVTFKGTTPFEFADWATDFTVNLVPTGEFLQGLDGRINKGFKDRLWAWDPAGEAGLFPDGGRSWDTIRVALRVLAHDLAKTEPEGGKVNVWFTGHSLGCGLASLAYARAINSPGDFEGSPVLIRDAYLFAAPVCGDRATSLAFNTLTAESEYVKTLWRVTNDKDAVATLLPQFGDYPHLVLSPTSPLGFAHLGAELQMRSLPRASNVTGSFFSFDTVVDVVSEFTEAQLRSQRDEQVNNDGARTRRFVELVAEIIPLLGRIIAHDTVLYWDQLSQISLGTLNWVH